MLPTFPIPTSALLVHWKARFGISNPRLAGFRQSLRDTEKRIRDLGPHAHKAFEHENKLSQLVIRQQEIIKSLDLSRDQAPNVFGANENEHRTEEAISAVEATKRVALKQVRKGPGF